MPIYYLIKWYKFRYFKKDIENLYLKEYDIQMIGL